MSLRKKYLKSKPICKVSFDFPVEEYPEAKKVELMASFNDWQPVELRKSKGQFTRTFDLETGQNYQFRYRINEEQWENDSAADAYVPNGIDGDNSVVSL
jgi:1,4-alpha-glucan branching enzyme